MFKTLVTASDVHAPMNEVVPGHFVHACRQRTWAGRVSDETVTAWLRAQNLPAGTVTVYRIEKARRETFDRHVVVA